MSGLGIETKEKHSTSSEKINGETKIPILKKMAIFWQQVMQIIPDKARQTLEQIHIEGKTAQNTIDSRLRKQTEKNHSKWQIDFFCLQIEALESSDFKKTR